MSDSKSGGCWLWCRKNEDGRGGWWVVGRDGKPIVLRWEDAYELAARCPWLQPRAPQPEDTQTNDLDLDALEREARAYRYIHSSVALPLITDMRQLLRIAAAVTSFQRADAAMLRPGASGHDDSVVAASEARRRLFALIDAWCCRPRHAEGPYR